jgi:hypothetical protein
MDREKILQLVRDSNQQKKKTDSVSRRVYYEDIESLLNPGFLSHMVEVNGVSMSLRTLYPGEYFLLKHRVGRHPKDRDWKEWVVSHSIWMMDGQILLDTDLTVKVRKTIKKLPAGALDSLFSVYTSLYNRLSKALELLEAYCYEEYSRTYWRMLNRGLPASDNIIGIQGVEKLGSNYVQRIWNAYNLTEDDRALWNANWGIARMVISSNNPKGAKKLFSKDESDHKLEEDRRTKVIYRALALENDTEGVIFHHAVSVEELSDEMQRALRGEKDQHDIIIDRYKEWIRQKQEANIQSQESKIQDASSLLGQDQSLIRDFFNPEKKKLIYDSPNAALIYDKYVNQDIKVGGIDLTQGRAVELPTGGLEEALADRKVTLKDD